MAANEPTTRTGSIVKLRTRDSVLWRDLVASADPATYGEVVEVVHQRLDVDTTTARAAVDSALRNGTLTEDTDSPSTFPTLSVDKEEPQTAQSQVPTTWKYISDPCFDGDRQAVQAHYERAKDVYRELAVIEHDNETYLTSGFAGNSGWYRYEENRNVADAKEGYDRRGWVTTFEGDLDYILGQVSVSEDGRSLYNITSWKDPESITGSKARLPHAEKEERGVSGWGPHPEADGDNPLPNYEDIRGFGFWADIDLNNHLKPRRGDLDTETLRIVEDALQVLIEEVADLYDISEDAVRGLDSGGGAYIYAAPEAYIPIAEEFGDDPDARKALYEAFRDRFTAWSNGMPVNGHPFEGAWQRVCERVPGAEYVLDPDWVQNVNRQSKAPLSIHGGHDVVVTPLRDETGQVDYTPTRVSEVTDELIARTVKWCQRLTSPTDTEAVSSLVFELFTDYQGGADTDSWQDVLHTYVKGQKSRQRQQAARRKEVADYRNKWDIDNSDGAWSPWGLCETETTTDFSELIAAVESIDVRAVIQRHACDEWNTTTRNGEINFNPLWRFSASGESCAIPDGENRFIDNKAGSGGNPAKAFALGTGILPGGGQAATQSLSGSKWFETLDAMREAGYNIPRFIGSATGGSRFCETCEPPQAVNAPPLDVDARRDAMTGDLYDAFIARDGLTVWAHNPGEGKTTCGAEGMASRDQTGVVTLPTHANCREFQTDDKKPDVDFHLKGMGQPVHDKCMDAKIEGRQCDRCIGHCETMCPVYSYGDKETIEAFNRLAAAQGVLAAHQTLDLLGRDWHGEKCPWMQQFDQVKSADRIVTVHDYLPLESVRDHGDIIIDDMQGNLVETTGIHRDDLTTCRSQFKRFADNLPDGSEQAETFRKLATFTDDLIDHIVHAEPGEADLSAIEPPSFDGTTELTFKSWGDIPNGIPDDAITEDVEKIHQYSDGTVYTTKHTWTATVPDPREALAQAKLYFEDTIIQRITDGIWKGTPLCFNGILAALAAAGVDGEACRVAAGIDVSAGRCPWCNERVEHYNGTRICTSDICHWNEAHTSLTTFDEDQPPARIAVTPWSDGTQVKGIKLKTAPPVDVLPDPGDVLVLDATPRPPILGSLFGVDTEDIHVEGNDPYSLPNATVTQIADGAYHRQTIIDSTRAGERQQAAIQQIADMHDDVLFIVMKSQLQDRFKCPDGTEVMNYYALRGLDRPGTEAVVLVGAPHPAEDDLKAEARALAVATPGVSVGGNEFSTRNEAAPAPYRKYNYVDDDGQGRQVASKMYTGLVGDLFDARHADEIEQAAHRNRPILATEDDPRHVYLLTNVATSLPIDHLVSFDGFLDPTGEGLDIRDSAKELLQVMVTEAQQADESVPYASDDGVINIAGTVREWHDAAEKAGMGVSKRTVRRALDDLKETGLVEEGVYAQRRGRLLTLTLLGARVAVQ